MRISDWSSDVCSSELPPRVVDVHHRVEADRLERGEHRDRLIARVGRPVEALVGREVDAQRAVQDDRRRSHAYEREGPAGRGQAPDRTGVVQGKSGSRQGDLGGRLIHYKKTLQLTIPT